MQYLLSEDSQSGADLWRCIANIFGLKLKVLPFKGNQDLLPKLKIFRKTGILTCGSEDYDFRDATRIIIAYDMFESGQKHIQKIKDRVKFGLEHNQVSCEVFISIYGSLEAAILSFRRFRSWVAVIPDELRNRAVTQSITLHTCNAFLEYFNMNKFTTKEDSDGNTIGFYTCDEVDNADIRVKRFHEDYKLQDNINNESNKRLTTEERMCTALLGNLTMGGDFSFQKSQIGPGWISDCQDYTVGTEEYQKHDCQEKSIAPDLLAALGWSESDICGNDLAGRNMTARKKLLMLFEESILAESFAVLSEIDSNNISGGSKRYSIKDVLGISHFHAAYEENSPTKPCSTCRLRESPAYKEAHQGAGQQSLLDVNQLPPPEPLPETTPQWNQQQPNNTTAWNPYQQPVEAWEQQPQYLNELPAPAGNPDNIDCIATSVFVQIEGYLFCTQKGTYGIWKEGKNNEKVISIVGLLDKQPITIGPAEKKLIKELRAEATLWEQKQIGSYGNGWQLTCPVSIAFEDKPK